MVKRRRDLKTGEEHVWVRASDIPDRDFEFESCVPVKRHFFLRFYSQETASGSKPRVEVVYYRVIGKSDEKLVIKRTRKNHLPYHLRRFGKNDPALK
jgi:hypothetical protein